MCDRARSLGIHHDPFSSFLSHALRSPQVSEEVSEGVLLWNASLVLKAFLEDKKRSEFDGASVLELGAGAGHLSLALSRMGARVTSTEAKCKEKDKNVDSCRCWGCVEQLRRSLSRQLGATNPMAEEWVQVPSSQAAHAGAVRAVELDWGEAAAPRCAFYQELVSTESRPEIVIMSEVIYNQSGDSLYEDEFHDDLVWTLMQLVKPGTVVYNVFVDRPFSFFFFAKIDELPDKPFQVEQIKDDDFDNLGLTDDDAKVYIHRLVYSPH